MQRLLILTVLGLTLQAVNAQQLPQLTQYQFNDYVFNPAVAGSRPFFELRSAHRYQWVGIQDAPRTFMLSGISPVGTNMGVGAFLYTDHVGPTRRTGFQASYAYHLRLAGETRLSLALAGGLVQFLVDGSKIQFNDPGDPALDDQLRGELKFDAQFAVLLHHPRYWVGAAIPQLIENEVRFMDQATRSLSSLEMHNYFTGGYRFPIGDDWKIEPSFMVKYVSPVPVKVDLTATVRYRDAFWIGGSYRTNDAYCAMLGYWHKRSFQFGYSYDIITSNLRNYSSGTHEVMLAVTIGRQPR